MKTLLAKTPENRSYCKTRQAATDGATPSISYLMASVMFAVCGYHFIYIVKQNVRDLDLINESRSNIKICQSIVHTSMNHI